MLFCPGKSCTTVCPAGQRPRDLFLWHGMLGGGGEQAHTMPASTSLGIVRPDACRDKEIAAFPALLAAVCPSRIIHCKTNRVQAQETMDARPDPVCGGSQSIVTWRSELLRGWVVGVNRFCRPSQPKLLRRFCQPTPDVDVFRSCRSSIAIAGNSVFQALSLDFSSIMSSKGNY